MQLRREPEISANAPVRPALRDVLPYVSGPPDSSASPRSSGHISNACKRLCALCIPTAAEEIGLVVDVVDGASDFKPSGESRPDQPPCVEIRTVAGPFGVVQ